MNELERISVCLLCESYLEGRCNFCACPGAGIVDNPDSRCPKNLWPDGWGEPSVVLSSVSETEIDIVYTDYEHNRIITQEEEDIAMEISQDPLYIFSSEAEMEWFFKMKMILSLN